VIAYTARRARGIVQKKAFVGRRNPQADNLSPWRRREKAQAAAACHPYMIRESARSVMSETVVSWVTAEEELPDPEAKMARISTGEEPTSSPASDCFQPQPASGSRPCRGGFTESA
jgi:hypothetical protein